MDLALFMRNLLLLLLLLLRLRTLRCTAVALQCLVSIEPANFQPRVLRSIH